MSDAKKTREEEGERLKATWLAKLTGLQLFLESLIVEQQQLGRPFRSNEPLPTANEALKAEIFALGSHMEGPQLVVAREEPKTPLKPN